MSIGSHAQQAEGERMRSDRGGAANVGWVAWLFAAENGRALTFANRKLGDGVDLLGTGLLPLAGRRHDGWSLAATGVPVQAIVPPTWLIAQFRGRWTKADR